MLKRRILRLAVAVVTTASVAGLTTLGATAASAARAQPAMTSAASRLASPDVITDSPIENSLSGQYVHTNGHNNLVVLSFPAKSLLSQIDCRTGVTFPNGTRHNICLLENESGLCLDAVNTATYIYLYAESCQVGDGQEYWWAESTTAVSEYWFINFYWSTPSSYAYMVNFSPHIVVQIGGGADGAAQWFYP